MTGAAARRVLHCIPPAAGDEVALRIAAAIEGLGAGWHHELALTDGSRGGLPASLAVAGLRQARDFPAARGSFGPRRLSSLAQAMLGFDLLIGYGWPAVDLCMAHTLFRDAMALPPLLHCETAEGWDAQAEAGLRRRWYRRLAFGKVPGLVAGSGEIEVTALHQWQLPRVRVQQIPIGIETSAFVKEPRPDALRVLKRPGELWVGCMARLDHPTDWTELLGDFASLPTQWHLVILGEGAAREAILAAAVERELSHRVHLPGAARDRAEALALFDLFVMPAKGAEGAVAVAEAMAAGLPLAASPGFALADMPAEANREIILGSGRPVSLASQFAILGEDSELRRELGEANRQRARARYDRAALVAGMRQACQRVAG